VKPETKLENLQLIAFLVLVRWTKLFRIDVLPEKIKTSKCKIRVTNNYVVVFLNFLRVACAWILQDARTSLRLGVKTARTSLR